VLPHQLIERPAIPRPRTLHQDAVCFLHRPYSDARTPWCVGPAAPPNLYQSGSRMEALPLRLAVHICRHRNARLSDPGTNLQGSRSCAGARPPATDSGTDSGLGDRSAGSGRT
jgi:hypothetical protein